jgi:hypothetical protein
LRRTAVTLSSDDRQGELSEASEGEWGAPSDPQ